nr:reverse transcriptase [Tanacetum cinerariifolium]
IPTELPPQRTPDHQVPLMPNTPLINVRPYRHPPNKKDAIELMLKELLKSRVIKTSQSPFSSPIVMVKKKDGSWRIYVDYRQLNKYTVKDKFPIPVIEELIDELSGSVVFSKHDFRAGYHQIKMSEADICKTAFKTREVFFDDILIYSKSMEEHGKHLELVLQVMQDNTLFAKKSKCSFAMTQVEYLGHKISTQGVSTDPSKIKAMLKWPTPTTIKQLKGFLGLTLQKAMMEAPMLALPNFDQEFVVETDASGTRIEVVLCQNGNPIAYLSKTLATKHQSLSTYTRTQIGFGYTKKV